MYTTLRQLRGLCSKPVWVVVYFVVVYSAQAQPRAAPSLSSANSFADTVGIYHWGGQQAQGIPSGIRAILDLNGHVARIAVSPRMKVDYNSGAGCIENFHLADVLDSRDLRDAIGDPRLKVLILTVYDGTSFADCKGNTHLHPDFYSQANTAAVVQEYSDFVYRLYELFNGSGKKFILANWEGDNAIYCGQAYVYANWPAFRQQCDDQYEQNYAGNHSPDESVEGMVLWLKARYSGMTAGSERAGAAGFSSLDVRMAAEISAVHFLKDAGLKSMLYDVLTRVPFDYVSYSSYESLGAAEPVSAMTEDLSSIRSITKLSEIIVGELGFPRSMFGEKMLSLTNAVTTAALEWGASYVIQWNLYDQDVAVDFGLFDLNGNITPLGDYYKERFCGRGCATPRRKGRY